MTLDNKQIFLAACLSLASLAFIGLVLYLSSKPGNENLAWLLAFAIVPCYKVVFLLTKLMKGEITREGQSPEEHKRPAVKVLGLLCIALFIYLAYLMVSGST